MAQGGGPVSTVTVTTTHAAPPTHRSTSPHPAAPANYQGYCRTRDYTGQGWFYRGAKSHGLIFEDIDPSAGYEYWGFPGFTRGGQDVLMRIHPDSGNPNNLMQFGSVQPAPTGSEWMNTVQAIDGGNNWVALPDYFAEYPSANPSAAQAGYESYLTQGGWRGIVFAGNAVPGC